MNVQQDRSSEEVLEKYYRQLGLTPESITRDVATLQSWMEKQPHLPHNIDLKTLEAFLTHCKNSMERAKTKLDLYYSARAKYPGLYLFRDPAHPDIEVASKTCMLCICPKLTPDGEILAISKLFDPDIKKFNIINVIKVVTMVMDAHLGVRCTAVTLLYDCQGATLAHIATFTPSVIKELIDITLKSNPFRFSGFHAINAPPLIQPMFALINTFLSPKIKHRIFVHKDLASLHSHVSRDVVPPEYGGSYPNSLEEVRAMTYQSILDLRQWFLEQNIVMADETRRPGRKVDSLLDLQLEGSFRSVEID